jgi:tRNA nucleotidyltransferase (CCA-adding enzyme)
VGWIVRTLEEAGFEAWAVGGAVRDELLGEVSTDWDLATSARPPQVRRLFKRTVPIGVEHGTVGVLARDGTLYEVTTYRKDVTTDGRHAVVAFADRLDDDLARRDFTINAIAWHPLREEIHDPFDGAGDLAAGVLRTVGEPDERFAEDHLRVLRALRFAGRFSLRIDAATHAALERAVAHLPRLSPERVREELLKVLAQDARPSRALRLYRDSGALAVIAPELAALPEASWAATLAEVDHVPRSRPVLRLAALLGRAGEPEPRPGDPPPDAVTGLAASDPAAARGSRRAAALLTRLRASNAQVARVSALVAAGHEPPPSTADEADLRRWLARTGPERLPDLARLWIARHRAGTMSDPGASVRRLRNVLARRPPLAVGDLAVDGRDLIRLGLRPGPDFGRILDALLDRVLEAPERNRTELLEAEALQLAARLRAGDDPEASS